MVSPDDFGDSTTDSVVDVIGFEEAIAGVGIAVLLALSLSWLQGSSSTSFPNLVLWSNKSGEIKDDTVVSSSESETGSSFMLDQNENRLRASIRSGDEAASGQESSSSESRSIQGDKTVFGEESWKEISRPENYIYYATRVRNRMNKTNSKTDKKPFWFKVSTDLKEKKWVVAALVFLFVPIFSIEIFFALSRQFMCGGGDPFLITHQPAWAQFLCSPHR